MSGQDPYEQSDSQPEQPQEPQQQAGPTPEAEQAPEPGLAQEATWAEQAAAGQPTAQQAQQPTQAGGEYPGYPGYAPADAGTQYAPYGAAGAYEPTPGAAGYAAGPPPGSPGGGYGYGYAPAPQRTDDKAVWALVSSIAGFIVCPIVLHVVGWVLANQSLRAIRESRGQLGGDGVAKTARVLGIVGVVLYGLAALVAIVFFAILIPLGVVAGTSSFWDFTDQSLEPTTISQIDDRRFEYDVGETSFDLTGIDFTGEAVTMAVDLGAGNLTVEVPDDVTVDLDAQVGAGRIDAFGESRDGLDVDLTLTDEGTTGSGTLTLDLEVGVGEIDVDRG